MDAAWVDRVMEQAQVFASAWSLVGGRFDTGDGLALAEAEKAALRRLVENAPAQPVARSAGAALTHDDLLTLRGHWHG